MMSSAFTQTVPLSATFSNKWLAFPSMSEDGILPATEYLFVLKITMNIKIASKVNLFGGNQEIAPDKC